MWDLSFRVLLPNKQLKSLYLQGTKHRNKREKISQKGAQTQVVIFIPYTSISSFYTLPLVLLNSISGWKKASLLSALCQPDKEKLTGCQFPFDPKVRLRKRKIFSACLEPSWGVPHSAASLLYPLAHIPLRGSFFPTGFLKALFDLTLHKISCQTYMHHIHMNISISSFRLSQYYIRGWTSFLFSHYTTGFWIGKHHSFSLSVWVGSLLKKKLQKNIQWWHSYCMC